MRSSLAIDELSAHHAHNTLPEAWLDLAYGRLSAEEAAAAMEGTEAPEVVERSVLLFAPPSAEVEERRLAAILRGSAPAPARRRWPQWVRSGVVTLAAASLVLLIGREVMQPRPFDGGYDAIEMSPSFLEERAEPGAAAGVWRYREGQRITLRLRPRDAVKQEVGAVAFVVGDGHGTPLRIDPVVNEHRVIEIAGTPEALGLPVGRWRLVVVVGPPNDLPRAWEDVQDEADAPYDVVDEAVEIVAAPDPE